MKKILFLCGVMLCCFSIVKSQSLNASPTTITSGGSITVTGSAESQIAYFSDLFLSGITVSSGTSGSVNATISELHTFNTGTFSPTSFKLTLTNSSTTPTTVFIRLTVTTRNDLTSTVRQFQQNINQVITVNPTNTQPTTYYNGQLNQPFQKNDCGPNAIGSYVTYSVPANVYTSTISQADANNKAQNEINANGQNFANMNGTCSVDYSNWITYANFPTYSDTFAVYVEWNKDLVNTPTVRWEVYQEGVFKGVVASNMPNTGSASLNIIQLLNADGHTFRRVELKLISEADPSISALSGEVDWFYD